MIYDLKLVNCNMKNSLYVFSKSIILACLIVQSSGYAQKYDNNWLIGHNYNVPPDPLNNTLINFSVDSLIISHVKTLCNYGLTLSISISDSIGNFLFYSDGCKVVGSDNQFLENGEGLNPGEVSDQFCWKGYPIVDGGLVLPSPNKTNEFDFITYFLKPTNDYGTTPVDLFNNHISFKNGKGKLTEKNLPILSDTFSFGNLTACKHANGIDWWIIVPKINSNTYYKILLDKDGFLIDGKQAIGPVYNYLTDWSGQAVFSPDGKKYARYDYGNVLSIFDFNRCNGELKNPLQLEILDSADSLNLGCGIAFSASSRFLYVISGCMIYQLDMDSSDILGSIVTIIDGCSPIYTANFYLAQLAPNNKIYISSASESPFLHVIEKPENKGKACNLKEYGLSAYDQVLGALPYFPNYRLGPLMGTGCDSISSTLDINDPNPIAITYPNPASESITIELMKYLQHSGNLEVSLIDISGKLLYSGKIPPYAYIHQIDIKDLMPEMYCLLIRDKFKLLGSVKVVKQ